MGPWRSKPGCHVGDIDNGILNVDELHKFVQPVALHHQVNLVDPCVHWRIGIGDAAIPRGDRLALRHHREFRQEFATTPDLLRFLYNVCRLLELLDLPVHELLPCNPYGRTLRDSAQPQVLAGVVHAVFVRQWWHDRTTLLRRRSRRLRAGVPAQRLRNLPGAIQDLITLFLPLARQNFDLSHALVVFLLSPLPALIDKFHTALATALLEIRKLSGI